MRHSPTYIRNQAVSTKKTFSNTRASLTRSNNIRTPTYGTPYAHLYIWSMYAIMSSVIVSNNRNTYQVQCTPTHPYCSTRDSSWCKNILFWQRLAAYCAVNVEHRLFAGYYIGFRVAFLAGHKCFSCKFLKLKKETHFEIYLVPTCHHMSRAVYDTSGTRKQQKSRTKYLMHPHLSPNRLLCVLQPPIWYRTASLGRRNIPKHFPSSPTDGSNTSTNVDDGRTWVLGREFESHHPPQ